ncbi:MAG: pitrilysin family protein [Andreesenia angusta]|nr:pitrilysin family protein [Andreesenia angusta]
MKKHFKYNSYKTVNGIEVYHLNTNTELFSLNLGIKIGSKYERYEEKGLSHFLEHMVFKGTKKRDNIMINEDIEELAGYSNAFTSYSDTVFKFMALNEEFENALEILSDIIVNPIFPEEEFLKEKEVIISEIKSNLDNIEEYAYYRISKEAFLNSFLRWDIAGEIEDIVRYSVEDVEKYYEKYYLPNNTVIVIASSFDDEYVFSKVEEYFKTWDQREVKLLDIKREKNISKEYSIYSQEFDISNILYLYSYENLSIREELALSIISYSLGENSNSHLFKRLREEKGMTYEVYSDLDNSEDVKLLYIYTELSRDNILSAKEIIDNTIKEVKSGKLVNEKSVKLMKKIIKTALASTLLDPQNTSDYLISQILDGRDIYEFERNLEIIDSLKTEEIIEVAKKVLKNPTVQIIEGGMRIED